MRLKTFLLFLSAVMLAAAGLAATKAAGTVHCKSDPATPVAIGDAPGHAYVVGKDECTWSKFAIAGVASKDGVSVATQEVSGDMASVSGYHIATMANGDKTVAHFMGKATLKDGKPLGSSGTWTYTSGTGKFHGIKGSGTFKGKANADGSMTYEIAGEYALP